MKRIYLSLGFVLLLVGALSRASLSNQAPARRAAPTQVAPQAPQRRVLIVSIDGLRPDVLLRARAPNARRLMDRGSFTMWARTVEECYTLPAHVSILTGVSPQTHGVEWNDHIEEAYSLVPTVFEIAKRNGLTTALFSGKTKFIALDKPGTLDWKYLPRDEPITDAFVAQQAVAVIRRHRPHVTFVHLAGPDNVGHEAGWGSPEQLAAVEEADVQLGVVLAALEETRLAPSTLVVLTSDHGGAGIEHGPDDDRSRHVAWIVAGPGVREGFDLTRFPNLTVNAVDTLPTVCTFLGLKWDEVVQGKAVWQALTAPRELLRDRKPDVRTSD